MDSHVLRSTRCKDAKPLTSDFDNGYLTIESFISSLPHLVVNFPQFTLSEHTVLISLLLQVLIVQRLDQMGAFHILLDEMGLNQMGLDKMGRPHIDRSHRNV